MKLEYKNFKCSCCKKQTRLWIESECYKRKICPRCYKAQEALLEDMKRITE